jgi:tripartite ATP-independent transporter DctP family solute receptor
MTMDKWIKQALLSSAVPILLLSASGSGASGVSERAIKLGYGIQEEHPLGKGVNRFVEIVNEKTGGKFKIRTYPNGSLGSESQMISATQGGVQEIVIPSSAPVVGVVKEFAVFDLPFLFNTEKEADAVLDGPVGQQLLDKLTSKGLIGLCFWENGFRVVTNSKRPITKSEDIGGLKIRTMQSPVYIDAFNTLGANAVPMAFTEVYTALETKAIDAQENPFGIIHASKFNEVQKYLSATKHSYAPYVVIVGKRFWDRLSAEEKKVLQDACIEARGFQRQVSREENAKILEDLKSKGMVYNEVSPEELEKMQLKLKPVVDKFTKEVGPELVSQTRAEIEKVRKAN